MKVTPITEEEVINIKKSLKPAYSTGYNNISNKVIIYCATEINRPLTYIFNSSLQLGICPKMFKYSIVMLNHKKGDRIEMNYVSISLLTF
jgi:hypothetical protein